MSFDENIRKQTLSVMAIRDGEYDAPLEGREIPIEGDTVWLRVTGNGTKAKFFYSMDGKVFMDIDYEIDASILCDNY